MSSKIEVSRELIERVLANDPAAERDAMLELRALLTRTVCSKGILCGDVTCECKGNGVFDKEAAPVVERQPKGALVRYREYVGQGQGGRELWHDWTEWTHESVGYAQSKIEQTSDLTSIQFEVEWLYTAPPELAELQATIANLDSNLFRQSEQIAKLQTGEESMLHKAIAERDAYKAEIEKLTSEPVLKSLSRRLTEAQMTICDQRAEIERLKLPYYLKLSDEMRAAGDHAVSRAREDGCASSPVLDSVFFEAAIQRWLNDRDDQSEIERLKGGQGEAVELLRKVCDSGEIGRYELFDEIQDFLSSSPGTRPSHIDAPADCGTHPHNDGLDDYREPKN
jgi:hypothetical protein